MLKLVLGSKKADLALARMEKQMKAHNDTIMWQKRDGKIEEVQVAWAGQNDIEMWDTPHPDFVELLWKAKEGPPVYHESSLFDDGQKLGFKLRKQRLDNNYYLEVFQIHSDEDEPLMNRTITIGEADFYAFTEMIRKITLGTNLNDPESNTPILEHECRSHLFPGLLIDVEVEGKNSGNKVIVRSFYKELRGPYYFPEHALVSEIKINAALMLSVLRNLDFMLDTFSYIKRAH